MQIHVEQLHDNQWSRWDCPIPQRWKEYLQEAKANDLSVMSWLKKKEANNGPWYPEVSNELAELLFMGHGIAVPKAYAFCPRGIPPVVSPELQVIIDRALEAQIIDEAGYLSRLDLESKFAELLFWPDSEALVSRQALEKLLQFIPAAPNGDSTCQRIVYWI